MRSIVHGLAALSAPLALAATVSSPEQLGSSQRSTAPVAASVYHCNDGDTCRVLAAGGIWLNVRLAGIDAPEVGKGKGKRATTGQPLGAESKTFLNDLVAGKDVSLTQVDLDHYNRPVVEIRLGETLVNVALLEAGMAEAYRGKVKRLDRAAYTAAEDRARQAKRGIWGLGTYQSPQEFRRAKPR